MTYRQLDKANILRTLERLKPRNEIETLTTGLSNKIWQKILLIEPTGRSNDRRTEETKA